MDLIDYGSVLGALVAGSILIFYGGYRAIKWVLPTNGANDPTSPTPSKCPDPECQRGISVLTDRVERMHLNQDKIFKAVDRLREDVAYIRGKMEK